LYSIGQKNLASKTTEVFFVGGMIKKVTLLKIGFKKKEQDK